MDNQTTSMFLAGDAMIARPWSMVARPQFRQLVEMMRAADVTIVNLETVIRAAKGYPQAESGGIWTSSPPAIAKELAWAGIDMVAHANNHSFDYGSEGVLETLRHIGESGIILAGSGKDLQEARAPRYFDANGKRIALVSMASTFVSFGRASKTRSDATGRPGINPLELTKANVIGVTPGIVKIMRTIDGLLARDTSRYAMPAFLRFGLQFKVGERPFVRAGRRLIDSDRDANLASISDAAGKADITVVSIHAHNQSRWLRKFVRMAIGAGADVVVVHGLHEVRGIELIDGHPAFYGLGDFVYQAMQFDRQPSEAYHRLGLEETATAEDLACRQSRGPLESTRATYEGVAARLDFVDCEPVRITLIPLDLQFGASLAELGRPQIATPELGIKIVGAVANYSKSGGAKVRYDAERNVGIVELSRNG